MKDGRGISVMAGVQKEMPAGVSVLRGISRGLRHARQGNGSSGFCKGGSGTYHKARTRLHDGRLHRVEKEK